MFNYLQTRSNWRLIGKSLRILTDIETPNNLKSLECFNVVMSSYAERGDVSQAVGILQTLKEYGLKPNGDSYSFAVEALGKDIHRRKKVGDRAWVHKNIEIADSILTMMEEDSVSPSADVVRNYVELLCIANEVSTATSLVNDLLSNGQTGSVNSKTLYRVALGNIEAGNVEKAKELASLTSETIPVLHRKIRSKEQRLLHLEGMRQRRELEHAGARDGNI
jgi:pentatricopeptide repeat protein